MDTTKSTINTRFKKGHIPWNKGKKGIGKWSEERKKRFSEYARKNGFGKWMKGTKPYNFGKKREKELVEKIVLVRKRNNSFKHNKEWRIQHSIKMRGENNPAWRGGITERPYPYSFNKALKSEIIKRDGGKCYICGKNNDLVVHHIDYNKDNCNPNNLITLCRSCHSKTNFNRGYWIKYFNDKSKTIKWTTQSKS